MFRLAADGYLRLMKQRVTIGPEDLEYYGEKAQEQVGTDRLDAEDYERLAGFEELAGHYYAAAVYYKLAEGAAVQDKGRAMRYAGSVIRAIERLEASGHE